MMMTSETSADKLAFVTGIGEIGGYAEQAAQEAVREAERVMAEAEAGAHEAVVERDAIGRRWHMGVTTEAFDDLAADLAAVLPMLDELAADADWQYDTRLAGDTRALLVHATATDRNRATLAGMDEPESHSSRCPSRFMGECLCGVAERAGMEAGR